MQWQNSFIFVYFFVFLVLKIIFFSPLQKLPAKILFLGQKKKLAGKILILNPKNLFLKQKEKLALRFCITIFRLKTFICYVFCWLISLFVLFWNLKRRWPCVIRLSLLYRCLDNQAIFLGIGKGGNISREKFTYELQDFGNMDFEICGDKWCWRYIDGRYNKGTLC